MSTTPPDEPTGAPGSTPPSSGPDYGAPPPSAPDYGAPPSSGPDYGAPPGGSYGAPPPPPPGGGYGGGGYGGGSGGWSVGNALGYGWTRFTANLGPIIGLTVIVFVGAIVAGVLGNVIEALAPDNPDALTRQLFTGVSSVLGFLVQIVLGAIVVRAALDITDGRSVDFGSIWGRIPFGPVVILGILDSVIVGVGFVLFFLPGLIAIFFLSYSTYFLLDRDLSPVDAIKASVNFVAKNFGSAFVWAVIAFLVTIVGVCLCLVGLLATIPIAMIGTAYTYKLLNGQAVAA